MSFWALVSEALQSSAPPLLREDVFHRVVILDAGQAQVQSLKSDGQAAVVDAQAMQDRGVQIVNVDRVFSDVVAEVVSGPVRDARLDSSAGHPH